MRGEHLLLIRNMGGQNAKRIDRTITVGLISHTQMAMAEGYDDPTHSSSHLLGHTQEGLGLWAKDNICPQGLTLRTKMDNLLLYIHP